MKHTHLLAFIFMGTSLLFSTDAFAEKVREGYLVCKGTGFTEASSDDIGACISWYKNDKDNLCSGAKSEGICNDGYNPTSICDVVGKKTGVKVSKWHSKSGWQADAAECLSKCEEAFGKGKCNGLIMDKDYISSGSTKN